MNQIGVLQLYLTQANCKRKIKFNSHTCNVSVHCCWLSVKFVHHTPFIHQAFYLKDSCYFQCFPQSSIKRDPLPVVWYFWIFFSYWYMSLMAVPHFPYIFEDNSFPISPKNGQNLITWFAHLKLQEQTCSFARLKWSKVNLCMHSHGELFTFQTGILTMYEFM